MSWHVHLLGLEVCISIKSFDLKFNLYDTYTSRILSQLSDGVKAHFPVILTRMYACDISVISLLRSRTLGNSPSAFRNSLLEVHSEEWLRRQLVYLQDCKRHKDAILSFHQQVPIYEDVCPFPPFPTAAYVIFNIINGVHSFVLMFFQVVPSSTH